jgi:ribosome-binding factor A
MTTRRQERVGELMQEELSLLIGAELVDPALADAMLTVTAVEVSQDLRNASVFVQHELPAEQTRQVLAALQKAEGFLRRALMQNLELRYVPNLTFHLDAVAIRARRIDQILDEIQTTEQPPLGTGDDEQPE